MTNEYVIDYKGFITEWRRRRVETPKDIRRGKVWKPYDISVPDSWSETAGYRIKMSKYQFFMIVMEDDEQYRYLLNKDLMSLLEKYILDESDNKKLLEKIALLESQLEEANSIIRTLKEELLKVQVELELERRK